MRKTRARCDEAPVCGPCHMAKWAIETILNGDCWLVGGPLKAACDECIEGMRKASKGRRRGVQKTLDGNRPGLAR